MAHGIDLKRPSYWRRLILFSLVSLAGSMLAAPALADDLCSGSNPKTCTIGFGQDANSPLGVNNSGASGTHDSPNGTSGGALNFYNNGAEITINASEASSTSGEGVIEAYSIGGTGDDSGDAGAGGAVYMYNEGLISLDVNGASKLEAFLKVLSKGGDGDCCSNDDNNSDGGNGGTGVSAKIDSDFFAEYTLTGTISRAFYGLVAQSVGGAGGQQNDSVIGDQLGGRGGDAGSAEVDNESEITYGSSSSRVQASSAVSAIRAESLAGSGGYYNGDAGNAGTVTIHNDDESGEIRLYLNMLASGQNVYGLYGYSYGGTGNASSDNSDRGGNGGNGGDVTITNSAEIRLDITGDATGDGAGIAAISEGGKGGKGPDEDQPGGNGGSSGNVSVSMSGFDAEISTTGDNVIGILAQSAGGQGGDASDSTKVAGTGGGGGFGGNAGTVTVTTDSDSEVTTTGAYASAIAAMSLGGGGGTGSDFNSILGGAAGNGGNGGNAGLVTVNNGAELTTSGDHSYGILAQSTAGSGGTGGVGNGFLVELGGDGGAGGTTGNVDVDNDGHITTHGYGAMGILAQSIGGGGGSAGSAGGVIAIGGNAPVSFRADGGSVTVDHTDHIITYGDAAIGMLGQSIGGGGGSATGATGIIGVGGQGSAGGYGGSVTTQNISSITTSGEYAFGLLDQSIGGGGGNGGNVLDFSAGVSTGVGGSAGGGGNGGTVIVSNASGGERGVITTSGYHATGLLAQSVGGGGGTGGDAVAGGVSVVTVQVGGHGGGGGDGGSVTIDQNELSVTTSGSESVGVKAQSVGGGGGDGGGASAYDVSVGVSLGIAVGGSGGVGGNGGVVNLDLDGGRITTGTSAAPTDNSTAVFAHSVGGGGGTGGKSTLDNLVLGVPVDPDGNTFSVSVNMGAAGAGGAAGDGNGTYVDLTDTILQTYGQNSMGVHAQSIGGGGGSGGDSSVYSLTINSPTGSANMSAAASVGGLCTASNCGGGNGGNVSVDVSSSGDSDSAFSSIITAGDYANGILAHSVGGGGGNAGAGNVSIYSLLATVNAGVAVGLGSQGGTGGHGGTVDVTLGANGTIQTGGAGARGIIAQSIGGGGGTSQGLSIYGTGSVGQEGLPAVPSVTLQLDVGMKGGSGGNGEAVTVTNDGTITTAQRDSDGIVAQSIGGGGGMGGSLGGDSDWTLNNVSNAIKVLKDTFDRLSFSMSGEFHVAVGGKGGTGGTGDKIQVNHNGAITTSGDYADGIVAQSVGGGGGIGGSSEIDGYKSQITANVAVGGSGGTGGTGGLVNVLFGGNATISTTGYSAYGVLAQSIGGGGGMGADGSAISNGTINIGSGTGGGGGSGNDGGIVQFANTTDATIVTYGDNSHGMILQSVGNGGGTGGVGNTTTDTWLADGAIELAIGGGGGNAGNGGDIHYCSDGLACSGVLSIQTAGDRAVGLLAQSVGGGGGVGGAGDPSGSHNGFNFSLGLDLGGSGGDGGDGGNVTIDSGHLQVATSGDLSIGILAQSIGGGGGFGAAGYTEDSPFSGDRTLSINLGGSGGEGGDGNGVYVEVRPTVTTAGDWAHAVVAQSVGGGGGVAGTTMASIISGDQASDVLDAKVIVGGAANGGIASGDGKGGVNVSLYDYVNTQGRWAMATIAQSIGGGGGIGNGSMQADGEATATATVSVGGGSGSSGDAGSVGVHFGSELAIYSSTSGAGAYGVLAQSIGGGGGLGTALTSAFDSTLTVGGAGTGDGGSVEMDYYRYVSTTGSDAHGIVLQSIGGSGGVGAFNADGGTSEYAIQLGGLDGASGDGGSVTAQATVGVTTTGSRSFGILAQSIGGGGGLAAAGAASEIHTPDNGPALNIGGQGNATGDGGTVNLTLPSTGFVTTIGYGSHAIIAQSIGGGGGYGGDASGPISLTPRNQSTGSGDGGEVTVTIDGAVTTTNSYSHGVIAQSIGGGGGYGGDQSGAFAGSTSTDGDGFAHEVTVTVNDSISATGDQSVGIFAQSQGPEDQEGVTVNVAGSVTGGSNNHGVGVWIAAGKNNALNVTTGGSIGAASGTAIRYDGDSSTSYGSILTVNNSGTITGNILLNNTDSSNAGTINNYGTINAAVSAAAASASAAASDAADQAAPATGGLLVGASLYEANVVNGGTLVVGHGGKADNTEISGDFSQSAEGTLSLDLDMAAGKTDRLTVRGDAALDGKLDINAASLLPGKDIVFLSVGGTATGTLETSSNPIFDIDIAKAGQDYHLSAAADFDRTSLNGSTDEIADHLQEVWDADGNEQFGDLFAALYDGAGQGEDTYSAMLAGLLPGVSLAPAARFQQAITGFNDSLMSCPKTSTGGLMLGETSCVWADISGGRFDQNGGSGYTDDSITYRMGTQVDLAPGWFLGLSGAYQHSRIDGDDGRVSGSGDAGFLGAALKREAGPWLFAGVISASYGSFDMRRRTGIAGFADAEGSPDVYGGSLRFRVARTFAGESYYVKPYIDLDAVYTRMSDYTESGGGSAGLYIDESNQFAFVASPMIEIGGSMTLGDSYMLRPYAYVGASLSTADDWTADARLAGAPAGVGMFEASLPMDDALFKVGAGLHLSKIGGMDIELQYSGAFSGETSSNSGLLRVNVPF